MILIHEIVYWKEGFICDQEGVNARKMNMQRKVKVKSKPKWFMHMGWGDLAIFGLNNYGTLNTTEQSTKDYWSVCSYKIKQNWIFFYQINNKRNSQLHGLCLSKSLVRLAGG